MADRDQLTTDELIYYYQIIRQARWRYELDKYEESLIREIRKPLSRALIEIQNNLRGPLNRIIRKRYQLLEREIKELLDTVVQKELDPIFAQVGLSANNSITTATVYTADQSLKEYTSIYSLGNTAKSVLGVSMSIEQLKKTMIETPLGGKLIQKWVDDTLGDTQKRILEELRTGIIQGEGYDKLVPRMRNASDLSFTELTTIARTFVQSANISASKAVLEQNQDLIKGWKWVATFEPGYMRTGRGTCLRCASLDGRIFPIGGGPPIPLHPRCRCVPQPVMKSWLDLGVDLDEFEDEARPYTIRPDENIDTGGTRLIEEVGTTPSKNYSTWFSDQSKSFQKTMLGEKRYELYKSGEIEFSDFVSPRTGRLKTIKELTA